MQNKTPKITLSILIPVRNEKQHIKIMLKILMAVIDFPYEIIVVYDLTNDNSIPIVKSLRKLYPQIRLVQNSIGRGVANAIRSGVDASLGKFILIFAADETGPVLAIEEMLYLLKKGCDLVSCTRYAHGGRRLGGSITQAILSKLGNRLFRLIVGTTFTDSTTGIKMFRREVFQKLQLESNVGWAIVFEMAIKAQIKNMRLGEVPIVSIDRLYGGQSSFQIRPWFKEYLRWFFYGIYHLRTTRNKRVLLSKPH